MSNSKFKIKKGDKVVMLRGKDLGKDGKIIKVMLKDGKVVVEGLNMYKKNVRPKKQGERGQIVSVPAAVQIGNVQLICSSCNKPSRMGFRVKGEKKERYCKKCNKKA